MTNNHITVSVTSDIIKGFAQFSKKRKKDERRQTELREAHSGFCWKDARMLPVIKVLFTQASRNIYSPLWPRVQHIHMPDKFGQLLG